MEFIQALGGSVIYEEYKGDLTVACGVAEADLAIAQRGHNQSSVADALVALGIVRLPQGEPMAAIEHFDRISRLVPDDAPRCLRAVSYRHLAVFLHFNTFPGGAGSNSIEVDARWQGVPYLQEEHPRWQGLFNQVTDPSVQVEAWLAHQVLPNLQPARATLESSRFSPPVPQVTQMVENTLQGLAMFQQAAGSFPYGHLAAADLCRRAGRLPESQDYLRRALAGYELGGDAAGMAACLILQGDWLAAHTKQYDAAVTAFEHHLDRGGANAGFTGILGEIMSQAGGSYGEAEQCTQQVRTHEQAFAFMVVNKTYAKAKEHLEALERFEGEDWWQRRANPWQELCTCAEMHEALEDLPAALRSYDLAITSLEARRKLLTRDELKSALAADRSAQYLYFLAARAALKTGDRARAFRYLENGKARALLDLMAATGARKPEPEPADDLLHRWRQLNAQLALTRGLLAQARNARQLNNDAINDLTNRIAAEDEQLHQAEKHLAESHPPFQGVFTTEARIISLDEAADALPYGSALLQYAFLGEDLLAWAITREGMTQMHLRALDARMLSRQILAFHDACARRNEIAGLAGFKLNHANFGIVAFCVVNPQMGKVTSQQNEMARIKHLARIADELDTSALGKVDQFDFRVVMINKLEPPSRNVLPKDRRGVLKWHLLERRDSTFFLIERRPTPRQAHSKMYTANSDTASRAGNVGEKVEATRARR